MNGLENIILPAFYAFIAMFVSVLVKVIINSANFKRTNSERGRELFKVGFFGPDLGLLSLGLVLSSHALRSLLNGQGIKTNFGDSFGVYFGMLLLGVVFFLLSAIACWLISDEPYRQLQSQRITETHKDKNGIDQSIEVWEIYFRQSLASRGGVVILGIGNLCGIFSVMIYSCFIYLGFVR